MKLIYIPPLFIAVRYKNINVIKHLVESDRIDINLPKILNHFYFS